MDKNEKLRWSWLGFFTVFMGLDLLAKQTKQPTFSQAVTKKLPWWVVVPASVVLVVHMVDMYRDN